MSGKWRAGCAVGLLVLGGCSSEEVHEREGTGGSGGAPATGGTSSQDGGSEAGGSASKDAGASAGGAASTDGSTDSSVGAGGARAPIEEAGALDAATTGEFLALTYNVAGLPEGLTSSPDPLARMPLIGPLLNDYDLVITQEDWLTPTPNPVAPLRVYHEILDAGATHPYRSISAPVPLGTDPTRSSALLSDGLNEFSRLFFDPSSTERVRWTGCYGDATVGAGDCLATKGFTLTVHTLAIGVEVDVYDLHGEAGRETEDFPLMHQNFEVDLPAFINSRSAGRAIILGGDTNLHTDRSPDGDIWQAFRDATGLVDVCETVDCGADIDQIDKFAYRSSTDVTIEPLSHKFEREKFSYSGGALSDHDPLAVRFRWTKNP